MGLSVDKAVTTSAAKSTVAKAASTSTAIAKAKEEVGEVVSKASGTTAAKEATEKTEQMFLVRM